MAQQNKQNATNELGTRPVGKLLASLAFPTIVAQLINLLYNVVDRIYIGHIPGTGSTQLTGVGLCLPLIVLVTAFAQLGGAGGAPQASMALGEKNKGRAEKILGNCASFLTVCAVLLTAVIIVFAEPLLDAFGASENTIGYALSYMRIYAAGSIFVMLTLGLNNFITAQGFAKISMMTVLIGAIINIVLDPVFIFVFGLGAQGAALATILAQGVSAVWVVLFLTGKKTTIRLRKENLKIDWRILGTCLALGLSPFVMTATESLLTITFNSSLARYGGDVAVGAMTILASVMQFSNMPVQGLTQGALPIISYNFGAKNPARVKHAYKLTLICCTTFTLFIWLIVMIFPGLFPSFFTNDPVLEQFASWAIRIYMAVSGIFGIQISCQQTFIAIGDAKTSLFIALLRKVILLIPLIYILPQFIENKVFAVFLAEPVADLISVITAATLFSIQFRKAIKKISA